MRSRGYDDDFGRIARQQRSVKEVIDEVARVGTLANPRCVVSLVDRGARAVKTDDQLPLGDMRDVALGWRNLTSYSLIAPTVPATPQTIDGVSYVLADEHGAEALYQSFRDGSVLRSANPDRSAPPEPEPTLGPADVAPVAVLNGTDVAGLAAPAAELLEAHGFAVAEVGDARRARRRARRRRRAARRGLLRRRGARAGRRRAAQPSPGRRPGSRRDRGARRPGAGHRP